MRLPSSPILRPILRRNIFLIYQQQQSRCWAASALSAPLSSSAPPESSASAGALGLFRLLNDEERKLLDEQKKLKEEAVSTHRSWMCCNSSLLCLLGRMNVCCWMTPRILSQQTIWRSRVLIAFVCNLPSPTSVSWRSNSCATVSPAQRSRCCTRAYCRDPRSTRRSRSCFWRRPVST